MQLPLYQTSVRYTPAEYNALNRAVSELNELFDSLDKKEIGVLSFLAGFWKLIIA